MIRILVGDCRQRLKELAAQSVQLCVTSPPYYALRDYSTKPLVWGGRDDCTHEWESKIVAAQHGDDGIAGSTLLGGKATQAQSQRTPVEYAFCLHCQAWRGHMGLEPTPELYIEHLVEIFREVRRVLKDSGVLVLNLGDSFKDKNLLGIPWRVALALQADGWYLRSAMPWVKASAMPESVRDRPTNAHEYVFLLAKSKKYFWDAEAIRIPLLPDSHRLSKRISKPHKMTGQFGAETKMGLHKYQPSTAGRNYRTSDVFNASLDLAIEQQRAYLAHLEHVQANGGLLLDEDGGPVALKVNPGNFKGAHFATFPPELVEPFVRAGTSEKGECPGCGAAWVRVVEKGLTAHDGNVDGKYKTRSTAARMSSLRQAARERGGEYANLSTTTGWTPSCSCPHADPVPQTVLDQFGGAATTGLVADRLQRHAILCELNADYAEMGRQRLVDDGGMFVRVSVE